MKITKKDTAVIVMISGLATVVAGLAGAIIKFPVILVPILGGVITAIIGYFMYRNQE